MRMEEIMTIIADNVNISAALRFKIWRLHFFFFLSIDDQFGPVLNCSDGRNNAQS
jgi:hypothetical protein